MADLRPDCFDRLVDVVAHRPILATPANAVDEVGDDLAAARRVDDFRMKLKAEEVFAPVFDRGLVGILRDRHRFEAVGQFREFVAVGIPDLERFGKALEQGT